MVLTKICAKCGVEKPLNTFHNRKISKDGKAYNCKKCQNKNTATYYQKNKKNIILYQKKYQKNNKEKISLQKKQYNTVHKEKIYLQKKQYNYNHKKERALWAKEYYIINKNTILLKNKKYLQTPIGKLADRKKHAKRKEYGYNELNKWFPGCVGHHMNKNDIIYVPPEINAPWHSQDNQASMNRINKAAIEWLMTQEI